MTALFPPNSRIHFPNRFLTVSETILPTFVDPVKDTSLTLVSADMSCPISTPSPCQQVNTEQNPFSSSTSVNILVIAIVTNGVVGAPFHIIEFPQIKPMQAFHAKTTAG